MSLRKKALQRIDLQCLDVGIWEYHQGDDCSWDLGKVKSQYENIDEFRKLVDFAISRDTLKLEDVLATLNFRELLECGQKAKGDGGEGLYEEATDSRVYYVSTEEHLMRDCPSVMLWLMVLKNYWTEIMDSGGSYHITYMRDYLVDFETYDGGNILLGDGREMRNRGLVRFKYDERWVSFVLDNVRYVPGLRRNLISLGTLEKEGFTVKMQSGKIKVIKGSLVVLSGTRRANCVYTLDGQDVKSVTRKRHYKGRKQLGRISGWKFKRLVCQILWGNGILPCIHILVNKVTSLAGFRLDDIRYWVIKLWRLDDVTSKVVLYRNMGFNESGEYKKTFIGFGVGTGSVQVLQGVEFKVEPREDHTFEVEPHGNVDHVAGSQEAVLKLAFAVAEAEKIYAHESLTFNNTVACEVISKWKAGLKDDMDARSDVYVLSNGCKKCSDDSDVYYWVYTPAESGYKGLLDKAKGNVLGMEIVRDQSGNTLRVSQSRFYNRKLVQTLLEGHSILLLEGSLSRGYCVMWKRMVSGHVYMRLEARSIRWFLWILTTPWEDRSMSWVDQSQAGYMTLTEAAKEAIWLKGLAIESGFELKIVAGIATGALSKAIPGLRFQHRLNL
ncbi:hypothetical protein Tco_0559217 [Tanacetum coccineum]|uniref:Retrovirus-related Pol polyprotein from transposon TNT 1-94-like beta-barrel domain-containing protein n=1 Tax=Tanacetum coccineum TaxID=301880 RepID=A0ABQ4XSJ9_9ASTR